MARRRAQWKEDQGRIDPNALSSSRDLGQTDMARPSWPLPSAIGSVARFQPAPGSRSPSWPPALRTGSRRHA